MPSKKPKMSAKPPVKRFAYWDCAPALPRVQGMCPRFWPGSILRSPLIDQRAPVSLLQSRSANPLASYALWEILSANRLTPATVFSSTEWRLHFRLGLFKMMFLGETLRPSTRRVYVAGARAAIRAARLELWQCPSATELLASLGTSPTEKNARIPPFLDF